MASNSKHSSTAHKLSKQLEVTVHTDYEEHQLSQSHQTHYDIFTGSDGQLAYKSDDLGVDGKVEGREVKTCRAIIDKADNV